MHATFAAPPRIPALATTTALSTTPALPTTPALSTTPALPTTPAPCTTPALPTTAALWTTAADPSTAELSWTLPIRGRLDGRFRGRRVRGSWNQLSSPGIVERAPAFHWTCSTPSP